MVHRPYVQDGGNTMKVALYARVSTDDKDQNPETQLFAMRRFCEDAGWEIYEEYVDQARARDYTHRKRWQSLQRDARQHRFKAVIVFRLDRAFRSVKECSNCLEDWTGRGIAFKSVKQDVIDTTTASGRFMLNIMAAVAELESEVIGERVAAGMARAKSEGRTLGRRALLISVTDICDSLVRNKNVSWAAKELKETFGQCSRAYIHAQLARFGTTPAEVIEGKWRPSAVEGEEVTEAPGDRKEFLKLPIEKRREILKKQALELAEKEGTSA